MPKLIVNYMRPVAVALLVLVTVFIVISYFYIPKVYAITLADFYHRYWRLLTLLFFVAILFLVFAFYVERGLLVTHWLQHGIAILFIGLFVRVGLMLAEIADTFLAFVG